MCVCVFRSTYPNLSHVFKGNGKTSAIARKKKAIVKDSGKVTKYRKKNRKKKESMTARQNPPNSVFRKFVRCHTAFSTRSQSLPPRIFRGDYLCLFVFALFFVRNRFYERGDLPVQIEHSVQKVQWKVEIHKVSLCFFLTSCESPVVFTF